MFDKNLMDRDQFFVMSTLAKATYFFMGMEADDEGFVNCKRVIYLYHVTQGEFEELERQKLIIRFDDEVAVITDWHKNNWLKKERIKPTVYHEARQKIRLTDNKEWVLLNKKTIVDKND